MRSRRRAPLITPWGWLVLAAGGVWALACLSLVLAAANWLIQGAGACP